jgi:hypothetical protein
VDSLLSSEEVKTFLEVQEPELDQLVQKGRLQAYKIGGAYLRFRKDEVLALRQELHPSKKRKLSPSWGARLGDFWRFNNFYILSLLAIGILFLVLVRS